MLSVTIHFRGKRDTVTFNETAMRVCTVARA